MEIELLTINDIEIARVISNQVIISNAQDAVEIIANCNYQGAGKIILNENNLIEGFFDLKTGIAGEVLQKFSTYRAQLAIVGDFAKYTGKSLNDFIFESNKTGRINFVSTFEEAKQRLSN